MMTTMPQMRACCLALAASFSVAWIQPAAARPPPGLQASLQDFRRTCATAIASYGTAFPGVKAEDYYPSFISRERVGGADDELANADELRRNHADDLETARSLLRGHEADPVTQRQVQATSALSDCMLRVALPRAPERPATPAVVGPPAYAGTWVSETGGRRITVAAQGNSLAVSIDTGPGRDPVVLIYQPTGFGAYSVSSNGTLFGLTPLGSDRFDLSYPGHLSDERFRRAAR